MITVSLEDVQKAQDSLSLNKTSLSLSPTLSKKFGTNLFFKWETEQPIKSFKIRGAVNKMMSLTDEEKKQGVIAASAGNHAGGVALAAHLTHTKARVIMMEQAAQAKIAVARKWGAEVILKGKTYDESYHYAQKIKGSSTFIHAFADPLVIAGQGTVGLEILEDLPEVDSVVMSIGGGGLISGVARAIKSLKPLCKIYGVVWDGTPYHCHRFHKIPPNKPCVCNKSLKPLVSQTGLTDGIAVKVPDEAMFSFFAPLVDDIVCVSEEDIAKALLFLSQKEGKIAEGSGATSLAPLLSSKKSWDLGKNCCVIISGGNIDKEAFNDIVAKYGK